MPLLTVDLLGFQSACLILLQLVLGPSTGSRMVSPSFLKRQWRSGAAMGILEIEPQFGFRQKDATLDLCSNVVIVRSSLVTTFQRLIV